jgi:chaperone BCS1
MNFNFHDLLANQFLVGLSGATALGGVLYVCRQIPHHLWRLALDQFSVGFDVKNSDVAFYWIEHWLAKHPYSGRARSLRLKGGHVARGIVPASDDEEENPDAPKYLLSPAPGNYLVRVGNRLAFIQRVEKEQKEGASQGMMMPDKETLHIRVLGRNRALLRKIIEDAYELTHAVAKKQLVIHVNGNDYWQVGAKQRLRPIESVILPHGVIESLVADMKLFMENELWYQKREIPWRRGYKLYGPPGCGKSSLVAGLASYFEMGVAVLNLNTVFRDSDLVDLLLSQPPRTLLLIEDLDSAFKERKADETKITFSSFLNAIDGLIAPSGRLLFVTTNHPEKLDTALVRPGRIDVNREITYATEDQARRFFRRFFPDAPIICVEEFGRHGAGLAPAEIQNVLLENQEDALSAVGAIARKRAA